MREDLEDLYDTARKLVDPCERRTFLESLGKENPCLREQLEQLLNLQPQADQLLDSGAIAMEEAATGNAGSGLFPRSFPIEKPGDVIDQYRLLERLGEGGCGVVYLAQQEHPFRRLVALKIIKFGMDTESVVARFEAERQALAMMDHPCIAKVLDGGTTDRGRPYFVMEVVRGVKINEFCDRNHLSIPQRLELFIQLCNAVQHAHQKGIIHRDLKPSNILVTLHDGAPMPKVIDFGIAKAIHNESLSGKTIFTHANQFLGTPSYMSPEQVGPRPTDMDTRSDIYSLGVLLYELLTGLHPFTLPKPCNPSFEEIREALCNQEPLRPSSRFTLLLQSDRQRVARLRQAEPPRLLERLRGDLDWIVLQAIEKDRARRYQTVNALATDLRRHLDNEPIMARKPGTLYTFSKTVRRNILAFAVSTLIFIVVFISLVLSLYQSATRKAALAHARDTTTRLNIANGVHRLDQGDAFEALPWFTLALKAETTFPYREQVHRLRVASVLATCPRLVGLFVHEAEVNSAAFSPNGLWLATASDDSSARVWNLLSNSESPAVVLSHRNQVQMVEFSSNNELLATASVDHSARIWTVPDGKPATPPLLHDGQLSFVRFSPNSSLLLSGGADFTARMWKVQTGEPSFPPIKHGGWVRYGAFTPDGRFFITLCDDKKIRLCLAKTGEVISSMEPSDGAQHALFTPDGKRIISVGEDGWLHTWDTFSGSCLARRKLHSSLIRYAHLSPDSTKLVTASSDGSARLWDLESWNELTLPLRHSGKVKKAIFSPDGRWVASAGHDHTARIWDVSSGQMVSPPIKHLGEVVWDIAFSSDGTELLTASHDHTARLYNLTAIESPIRLPHSNIVQFVSFTPDARLAITASSDGSAHLWNARSGEHVRAILQGEEPTGYAAFSFDGARIAFATTNGLVRIYNSRSHTFTHNLVHSGRVVFALFQPGAPRLLTITTNRSVHFWDVQTGQPASSPYPLAHSAMHASFSPDEQSIVIASSGNRALILNTDFQTDSPILLSHQAPVTYASFSPDSSKVVTASLDRTAQIWDRKTGARLGLPLRHTEKVLTATFSPDGQRILTASSDRTARLWDAQSGVPLLLPMTSRHRINSARFSPDGRLILTASSDRTARIWDAETGEPITPPLFHPGEVIATVFDPSGHHLITSDNEKSVFLWSLREDERPLDDIEGFASLYSGKKFVNDTVLVWLEPKSFGALFHQLRRRYPQLFIITPGERINWHRQSLARSQAAKDPFAASFHESALFSLTPSISPQPATNDTGN